jgi:DNA-binding CsgD family transcriptional regulator
MLTAWEGNETEAARLIEATRADGISRGEGRVLGVTGYAAAVLYNGLARYDDALAAARTVCEYEDMGFYSWCLYELVEAAARSGDRDMATAAVDKLAERAGASGTDWGLGALASAQAMLADDDAADGLFTEAIERLGHTRITVHQARAHLVYGEWLRRVLRRADARHHLTEAYEMFTRMGAQAFAERARRELAATGEKVRTQQPSSGGELTAQEAQIARLAGEGLTNQEIGAQLFISSHTVEWHLRKVFAKLGITSRRQLRAMSWAS